MTYELSRQQKERRALFEAEMQRRIQDLDNYLRFMNMAYSYIHHPELNLHSRQTKPQYEQQPCSRFDSSLDAKEPARREGKTAEHIPKDLGEWLHKDTRVLGEPSK